MPSPKDQLYELKTPHDSTSSESQNPEAALVSEANAVQYGDTQNDLSDMQRLGKKQEFKVSCTNL